MRNRKQAGQVIRIGDRWYVRYWERRNVGGAIERKSVTHQLGPVSTRGKRPPADIVSEAERHMATINSGSIPADRIVTIADLVEREGRALVLAVNKWDIVADKPKALEKLRDRLEVSLPQLQGVATVTLSAKTGRAIEKLMPAVFDAHEVWNRRIATPALNRWLEAAQARHPPPLVSGRRLKLRYMTQANVRPPTFALFASKPGDLPESYRGYLVKRLREDFELPGVPIRMMLRKGKNPYSEKD